MTPIRIESHYPGALTGGSNSTYLIVGSNGSAALIDAGAGDAQHPDALAEALASQRASLHDVLVTHGHVDHIAGAPILASAYPSARFHKHPGGRVHEAQSVSWRSLADGQRIEAADTSLVVLHTPGHSLDHVVFWHEATNSAFSGDLVIAGSSVIIPHSHGGDLEQYIASLERMRSLRLARLFPAHGPVIDDPEVVLRRTIEHRAARDAQVLEAVRARPQRVPSIVESIYDGLNPALTMAASENVRAHLEKLRREGRVVEQDGVWQERT